MPKIISTAGFNPRPSCEGRPEETKKELEAESFNPRPSCEGRPSESRQFPLTSCFNPRPSCEGRLCPLSLGTVFLLFQSTPLLRGATAYADIVSDAKFVSIHAPLARGDDGALQENPDGTVFQSTPLLRGATVNSANIGHAVWFQSTPLLRGATAADNVVNYTVKFQSTPLLRGATGRRFLHKR